MGNPMQVYVNDEPRSIEAGMTLVGLLEQMSLKGGQNLAIAVNDEVIGRSQWPDYQLQSEDRLLLIAPVGGG